MNRVLVAFLLPLVVLLGWCGSLEWKLASGREVRVAIQGYDPRDLLSGHYIQYSLDLNWLGTCPIDRNGDEVCICLEPMPANPGYSIGTWSGTCAERPSTCAVSLRGQCNGSRFTADVEQYYIPESLAPALARVPQNASVILKLDVEGRAHVQRVLVEEQSIEEYAAQVLQSTPQATN